jgi:hypothetical protein
MQRKDYEQAFGTLPDATDQTDCLASGRIEIVFDSPEKLANARQVALGFAQCAEDLQHARRVLERAQEEFEEAQARCENAENALKEFFS